MAKIQSAPADRVQLVMDPPQLVEWLKRATREGAAYVLKEFEAGRLGEPRTWFDLEGAAAYIGIAAPTLCVYCKGGVGPVSHKIGNARRFNRKDLDDWIL